LQWVEDSSNSSSKYTRNFFRNKLIPAIKKVYPEAEENLLDNIERFKKINSFYQSAVKKMIAEICEFKGAEVRIPIRKLKKYDYRILIYEINKNYGFGEKQVDEVIKLMDSNSGKFIENKGYQIIKHGLWLIIAPKTNNSDIIAIQNGEKEIAFGGGMLEIKIISKEKYQLQKAVNIAQLDAKNIEFPLILRRWKQGDYFYPLGMKKKKKLSRFFIDQKLSKNQKENIWVLESNRKIIWIVGMRIDERFKISDVTETLLLITAQQ
jgi:tRNA(Ile)-lysidine synthase